MNLSNIYVGQEEGMTRAILGSFEKAHIRQHTRRTKSGRMSQVREHDDSRLTHEYMRIDSMSDPNLHTRIYKVKPEKLELFIEALDNRGKTLLAKIARKRMSEFEGGGHVSDKEDIKEESDKEFAGRMAKKYHNDTEEDEEKETKTERQNSGCPPEKFKRVLSKIKTSLEKSKEYASYNKPKAQRYLDRAERKLDYLYDYELSEQQTKSLERYEDTREELENKL
jgi:Mg-chelatase subunit ChlI